MMNLLNNSKHQKSIALLLMVTVSILLVFPIQIHIHHELDMHGHDDHVVDYHMVLEDIDVEHISPGDTHVIEISADFITKLSSDNLLKVAAVVFLFLIMSLRLFSHYQRRYQPVRLNYQKYYSLSPPLRAPPL